MCLGTASVKWTDPVGCTAGVGNKGLDFVPMEPSLKIEDYLEETGSASPSGTKASLLTGQPGEENIKTGTTQEGDDNPQSAEKIVDWVSQKRVDMNG
ncbi:hypothetical protein WISP_50814 [Willisornis vidua]|uniref:Uncharacterized protein n=1 Tax=Willisornis vidua TaxID=1566151 RepID=A0ABQ9DJR0_9PASS|nr:hypothetical protein WISP_50814 [Willisornis vidua]